VGTAHVRRGLPCQDACRCEELATAAGEPLLLALVADGAGSAPRAEIGSRLACDLVQAELRAFFAAGGALGDLSRQAVEDLLARLQGAVAVRAEADGCRVRDYACTLLAAVVGTDRAVFFQVGDGAIVVSAAAGGAEGPAAESPGQETAAEYGWVFWPGSGEYENVTFFATEPDAKEHLEWDLLLRPIEEIALFSDGLQRLALHYASRTVHAPFFRSKLSVLSESAASPEALAAGLSNFLASPEVDLRTDDDRTLVLATRRAAGR
jgi:hypothetical protein